MSRLAKSLTAGGLKHVLSFGGGQGFDLGPMWSNGSDRLFTSTFRGDEEKIANDFEGYVEGAYKSNGIVFACVLARMLPFSEARFQYQHLTGGRPGELFGDQSLSLLENPWPNGTTGELLARMEQDASLAGNFYATIVGTGQNARIRRLRPDWVTIVSGVREDAEASPFALDAEVLGYVYHPRDSVGRKMEPILLSTARVVHWSPIPDPVAQWRGMSWLTPVLPEIKADKAATRHKLKFFERGATANFVVTYDKAVGPDQFKEAVKAFNEQHDGVDNAYKTIHLGGGSDARTVGADLKQIDFKATQGAGETRIAAASGVGAIIARFSEGMQGSSLNQGNYGAAKRQVADMLLRPNWRSASAALAKFASPPSGSRLWYDDRDISFLHEDAKDAAEIFAVRAAAYRQLVDAGGDPATVRASVDAQDISLIEHTGKLSVQLTDPNMEVRPDATPRELAEMVQKIYLGVGSVLTSDEARRILNDAGAGLVGPAPSSTPETRDA